MVKPKPQLIPIDRIIPTEALIPQTTWDYFNSHYDGTLDSLGPINVYQNLDGSYLPQNGNKRSAFLHVHGRQEVLGYVHPYDPQEIASLEQLAHKAQQQGVFDIDDLSRRVMDLEYLEKA